MYQLLKDERIYFVENFAVHTSLVKVANAFKENKGRGITRMTVRWTWITWKGTGSVQNNNEGNFR